jgi:SagB-type dehydrogenase family enzyme
MMWRDYHELTKHTPESLRRMRHVLDWGNMPDPFRHYEGAPVLDLPADPPSPEIAALELLQGAYGHTSAANGAVFLSQLLFYSAAVSASKRVPSTGHRYALRVNPSSGNLHPTEFHFFTRGLKQWPDGLYHYRPSSHMAEQRAVGCFDLPAGAAPVVFVLTSIAWREAWKYRDRAYRYCLHDMGHAWQALALAARALGCDSFAIGHFPDNSVVRLCRFSEDEWPMLILTLNGASIPLCDPDGGAPVWSGGTANRLSDEQVTYPLIDRMHASTRLDGLQCGTIAGPDPADGRFGQRALESRLPSPAGSTRSFGVVARTRRSALDFEGGDRSMSLAQLSAILAVAAQPYSADFTAVPFVQLYLYVHRVDGLARGVYRHWPQHSELEPIRSGDQRVAAAGLSLGQDLAGNACVAFSMIADLDRAARIHGDRGYRYAHFEAGAIGQRLYLAAEALGLRATGIGAFFDDEVNRYLNLSSGESQVVYHFAIGYPVPDLRLEA